MKTKFVNRTGELKLLEDEWGRNRASLVVIYGRRRVGKTELIKKFFSSKEHLYFLGRKVSEKDNLRFITQTAAKKFSDKFLQNQIFNSWDVFFEYLLDRVKDKTVIVFDEFPHFVSATPGLASIFQYWWDERLKDNPDIYLILCGSSISMMLEEVLLYKAPLYGRRTGQLLLQQMAFNEAWKFFPNKNFADFLAFYAVAGGIPEYLVRFSEYTKLKEALNNEVFAKSAPLYEEVEFLLKEELREPKNYFSILRSLALKRNKLSEIIAETGMEKSAIHNYLFNLENLNLVHKEVPPTEKNPEKSRKGRYWLHDNFFKFWFNFVLPLKEKIEIADFANIQKRLDKYLPSLVQQTYEDVIREVILIHAKELGDYQRIGRYWDKENEIDAIGVNAEENKTLFAEAKWSNKKVGTNIYRGLKQKAASVKWGDKDRKETYVLFSKRGFTKDMRKLAREEKIFLFQQDKLLG